jgi:hypothetical protein
VRRTSVRATSTGLLSGSGLSALVIGCCIRDRLVRLTAASGPVEQFDHFEAVLPRRLQQLLGDLRRGDALAFPQGCELRMSSSRRRKGSALRRERVWFCCKVSAMYDSLIHVCNTCVRSYLLAGISGQKESSYIGTWAGAGALFSNGPIREPRFLYSSNSGVACHTFSRCEASSFLRALNTASVTR